MNIGKYQIVETIGSGGMGVVYKALDPRISRTVAIKTISADLGDDPELRNRLLVEARSAGSLSHKNIITIYEMDEVDGTAYLAMEFLDGCEIKQHISQRTTMTLEQKLRIMIEICEGLAHAHFMGVVHGDIKPGNIFLTRSGQVKILDFGLARLTKVDPVHIGMAGTPSYMSPEEIRGEAKDHRSDIFSLGVVCYELLTYTKPFDADSDYAVTYKIMQSEPESVDAVVPDLPPELEPVIAKALEKDPSERYQNVEDMLNELEMFRFTLDERKQMLRQQNSESLGELERCVSANPELLRETALAIEELKQGAEFRDGTRSETGTPTRRPYQLDYMALVQQRNRIRGEQEKISALLDRRRRSGYLLMEVEELRRQGRLENALEMVSYVMADDPTYREAATLHTDLTVRVKQERERLERESQVRRLIAGASEACAAGDLSAGIRLLQEALSIDPADTQAGALLESTQIRMRDEERARETRVRDALANAEDRLAAEDVAGARAELQRALEAGGEIPVADDLTSRIGRAEQDAAAREKRAAERRARAAALLESARESMSASSYAEAVRIANEALVADPTCAEAAEIRRQALAAVEEERAAFDRREAGEREKAAGFRLLGERKYRESRAAFVRASEWLGDDSVLRVGIEEAEAAIRGQELQAAIEAGLLEARQLIITDSREAAEEQVNRVLELSPRNEEALALLAKIREPQAPPETVEPAAEPSPQVVFRTAAQASRTGWNPAVGAALLLAAVVLVLAIYFLWLRR